jgi:hypothetical protein
MKKHFILNYFIILSYYMFAQPICNSGGNLIIFSNYDGGILNVNVDQNIPNIKIGILSYEAVTVNLTGTFVNNVTGIAYAGYNSSNNTNCGNNISTTSFTGVPSGSTTNISTYPPSNLPNSNGNSNMICAYSCDVNSNQGGCNTVDQVEAYFLNYFQGSIIFSHKVQYGCWSGSQLISSGGNCCATIVPLSITPNITNASCQSVCNGAVAPVASGGQSPYIITLNNSSNFTNLCPGKITFYK